MRRLITVSYTGLNTAGGVPVFNRSLHSAFPDRECLHFCWSDFPWHPEVDEAGETEWGCAHRLNEYLVRSRLVRTDDVVVADGFWAAGLEHLPYAVSHSHGVWSHLTHEDVLAGKAPDMPYHHAAQVAFRQRWCALGKRITAVSDFIAEQMRLQWGFQVDRVINNGVDTDRWKQVENKTSRAKPLIMHGVNDRNNLNKGWDHVQAVIDLLEDRVTVRSLDEHHQHLGLKHPAVTGPLDRYQKNVALADADIFVHPSGFEGNSIMVAEALACGVPVIGYDVGYLWSLKDCYGSVIDRTKRSPEFTAAAVKELLGNEHLRQRLQTLGWGIANGSLSLQVFRKNWQEYVDFVEGKTSC